MAELTQQDRQELSRAVGEALLDEGNRFVDLQVEAAGAQDLFCEHWGTVKTVLQFIAGQVGSIGWAIRAIIAAGDFLHSRICR